MRFNEDLRKTVVFIGYPDATPGKGGIAPIGTGFLLLYGGIGYLATVKHLSQDLGRDPFLMRLNRKQGDAENVPIDGIEWFEHPDPTVDVAVAPLQIEAGSEYDCVYLDSDQAILTPDLMRHENVGPGSFTYTIGLFRLLSGEKRNLPICHFGTIALLPEDEKIPIVDWTDKSRKRRLFVEGYLIETHSISGLSGSPVFVRSEYKLDMSSWQQTGDVRPTDEPTARLSRDRVRLLGIWQGSWEAPPDEVLAVQTGKGVTVPVGMGVVVPVNRLIEVLEMPKVKENRAAIIAHFGGRANVVEPQSVRREDVAPAASGANPTHR